MSNDREEPKSAEGGGRPSSWRDVSSVIGDVDGAVPVAPSKMLGPDELAAMMKRSEPELAPVAPPGLGDETLAVESERVRIDAPPIPPPSQGGMQTGEVSRGPAPTSVGTAAARQEAASGGTGPSSAGAAAAGGDSSAAARPSAVGASPAGGSPAVGRPSGGGSSAVAGPSPADVSFRGESPASGSPASAGSVGAASSSAAGSHGAADVRLDPVGRESTPTSTASVREDAIPSTSVAMPAGPPREAFAWQPGEVKLVIEQGLSIGKEFLISDPEMLVGRRDPEQDFIPDIDLFDQETANNRYISRRQARFYFRDMRLYLEDLESSNGTAINNKLVAAHEPRLVNLNDKLLFGQSVLLRVKRV